MRCFAHHCTTCLKFNLEPLTLLHLLEQLTARDPCKVWVASWQCTGAGAVKSRILHCRARHFESRLRLKQVRKDRAEGTPQNLCGRYSRHLNSEKEHKDFAELLTNMSHCYNRDFLFAPPCRRRLQLPRTGLKLAGVVGIWPKLLLINIAICICNMNGALAPTIPTRSHPRARDCRTFLRCYRRSTASIGCFRVSKKLQFVHL